MGVLVFMDVRSVKLLQKVNPKLMLGCTTTLMESGHPGGLDMEDTVLVFMDARSVKLLQKVNPMLTLGCTITHMVYGQPGTLDTIPMGLLCLLIITFSHQIMRIPKFNAICFSKLKNS